MTTAAFEIFLVAAPGHETMLAEEARACRFAKVRVVAGGVTIKGTWPEVWRANLELRGTARILARIGTFKASHLTQLEIRARELAWGRWLRPDMPFRVEVTCARSRIYHTGAAAERIERAIRETLGAPISPEGGSQDAEVCIKARIENDLCVVSIDSSGEPLHKRGHKTEVVKAPMRETMAALFLRQCGYDGHEPVVDPMCGSGTFIIEAAEIASGLKPGRSRRFAFEQLATFNAASFAKIRNRETNANPAVRFYGCDRDAGAIRMSRANAERAGITGITEFQQLEIEDLKAPDGPPGLVIVNPPYGARIGDKQPLPALYRALGRTLLQRCSGWRIGLITSEPNLAQATGLPFKPPADPVLHGGLRVTLYQSGALP